MRSVSLVLLCLFLISGLAVGGFLRFAEEVAMLEPPAAISETDAIVVLTGGSHRIDHAIRLFNDGVGDRLLISGVNPLTTGNQIKNMTSGSDALFECCVDIGHDAIDTIGNANETARWIREHGFSRVLIVTSDYHIPRSLLELRRVDPLTTYTAYPVAFGNLKTENWLTKPEVLRLMIGEYSKYAWARLSEVAGTRTASGLRTDQEPSLPEDDMVQVGTE
ncbi:YdcF family protein [Pararhizobium haloflavum]|uniref:YdcF family protein n=1 Tax=Pararhizobium haloflavum TaxID=2037914 RepID=UPI000C1A1BC2|nr:YdcF family protein [Pararhizobium haloflavum]